MAFIAKQKYKLDIAPGGGWVIVYASRHDDGAREIEFEITNQGRAFSIPASINVSVQGIKSNGSYFSHSCSYSGNIVTMALADDMTDIIGKSICVLKFTNSSQQKLATAKFVLNVDTDSSSEGIIIDTDAEEIFNQMLNDIRAQAASISVDIAELQSMVGSPLVASTVSGMTDHNKIYVYTGSESGYTSGNWYYWNGSAWTSGGVYNSTAFETDKTLSVENMAADAKVVGDTVGLNVLTLDRIGWVTINGIFDTSATNYRTSDYITTNGNRHFRLIGSIQRFYTTNTGIVSCFDINHVFIGFALQITTDDGLTEHDFTVLDDTAYICVTTNKWTPAPSLCPLDWINTTDLYSYHKANSYKTYYGDAQLVNTGKCLKPDLTVVSIAAFNMSDPILCDGATQVTVLNAGDNSYYGVAFFTDTTISNDNFLRGIKFTSAITPSDPLTISVPKAAKYVMFSARVNFRAYIAYDYTHFNSGSIVKKVEGITNFSDAPFKIVLGGDSITAGQGGTGYSATGSEIATIDGTTYRRNDNGYCWANNFKSYIESNYNATVTNNGISGMDSSFWNLNKSVLIPADTDLFILMIGANDRHSTNVQNPATLRLKLTRYYNNLCEIIRYCDANNIKIILMSPIPSSHDNEQDGTGYVRVAHEFQWNGVIAKLSAFYGMEYINLYNRIYMYALTRNENFESYLTDGLHPNDTGYRVMYYQILDGLGLAPHFDPIS